jgi:hypothetical protein
VKGVTSITSAMNANDGLGGGLVQGCGCSGVVLLVCCAGGTLDSGSG